VSPFSFAPCEIVDRLPVTLPLWTPTPVSLGDVGYLSKPSGGFVTLMNALEPHKNAEDTLKTLPSVHGYGVVKTGSQRQDKRSFTQKGIDKIAGLLRFGQSQSS
jgi:abelson tyrosine-protein kinase 1